MPDPKGLAKHVGQLLETDPDERPSDLTAWGRELNDIASGRRRHARRRRAFAASAVAVLVGITAGLVISAQQPGHKPVPTAVSGVPRFSNLHQRAASKGVTPSVSSTTSTDPVAPPSTTSTFAPTKTAAALPVDTPCGFGDGIGSITPVLSPTTTTTTTLPAPVPGQPYLGPAAYESVALTARAAVCTWSNFQTAGGTQGPTILAGTSVRYWCAAAGLAAPDGNTSWLLIQNSPWDMDFYAPAYYFEGGEEAAASNANPCS